MMSMIEYWNAVAEVWWPWMVSASWQSTVVAGLLLIVVVLARRSPSPVRYGLLFVALLKFAMPPLWSSPTGLLSHIGPTHQAESVRGDEDRMPQEQFLPTHPVESQASAFALGGSTQPLSESAIVEIDFDSLNRESDHQQTTVAPEHSSDDRSLLAGNSQRPAIAMDTDVVFSVKPSWQAWLMLLHLTGMFAVVVIVVRQLRSLTQLVRTSRPVDDAVSHQCEALRKEFGIRRRIRVLQSNIANSPIAFGIITPTIILPAEPDDLRRSDLKTILGHELAHLRHGDAWTIWLQLLLMAVWWFHPVFWLLHNGLRRVREDCCDDRLIASGLATADDYCDTLLRVASQSTASRIHVACSMADELHPLANRLKRILDSRVRRAVRLSLLNLTVVITAAIVLLPGLQRQSIQAQEAASDSSVEMTAVDDEFVLPEGVPVAKQSDDRFPRFRNTAVGFAPLQVSGRCVDFNGKPVAGASVMLLLAGSGSLNYTDTDGLRQHMDQKVATVLSDAEGNFKFDIERFPVLEFKPNPVEKPREATFSLLATADNYAVAWRSDRTLRFQARPAVLDPDEAARLFFLGEPIELNLTFQKEVQVYGVVSDDLGQPVAGATVMLGLVAQSSTLPGQAPDWLEYQLIGQYRKVDSVIGWGFRELPSEYRETKTDNEGRYIIRGMPANTVAAFCVDYQRTYSLFRCRLKTADGESTTRNHQYIGTKGEFHVTLTRPRTLTVALTCESSEPPRCIVRAQFIAERSPVLRDGAITKSVDGTATLQLPPGKFKLFIEPLPGQRLVASTHEIEIHDTPLEQMVDLKVLSGAEVVLRSVVKGTKTAIEGVRFSVSSEADKPPVQLQSQTVFADHPRTNSDGLLKAIVFPGEIQFQPSYVPKGFTSVTSISKPFGLKPGSSTVITFQFDGTALVPDPPDNKVLAALYATWDRQKQLIATGHYTYRQNSFLRGEITPLELDDVFALLEGKTVPQAETILQHVFPTLLLSGQSHLLAHGNKLAVAHAFGEPQFPWHGMNVSEVRLTNGGEQVTYSSRNHRLDIRSRLHVGSLDELVTVPSMFHSPPEDTHIEEDGDKILLAGTGTFMAADRQTGFVHELNSMRPDGTGRSVQQFGPVTHPNGAVTPTFRIDAHFKNHTLDRAKVTFLDAVEFVDEFPAETFAFAAPAGTLIQDYRPDVVGAEPRQLRIRHPVSDAVAWANKSRPARQPSAKASTPAAAGLVPPAKIGVRIGDEAPVFNVAGWYDQNGKTVAPELKGKVVIINFHEDAFYTFVKENRTLRQSLKLFEGRNIEFVNVYRHKTDATKAIAFMKEFLLPWKFAIDSPVDAKPRSAGKTFEAFDISRPSTVVIDASGHIAAAHQHVEQSRAAIQTADRLLAPKK